MSLSQSFSLDDFEYDLPPELIAQEPPPVRHQSRLMHLERQGETIAHHIFSDLPGLLSRGDLLVINDTRVIPCRLLARRQTGAHIEILLIRPQTTQPGVWVAMAAPLKKLRQGELLVLQNSTGDAVKVLGFAEGEDGQRRVVLDFFSQANVHRILSEQGLAPLPPYIERQYALDSGAGKRDTDLERYQTVFAESPGAVAAPTAGLHFSPEVFQGLAERGVEVAKLTLHVGPGTFKPISSTVEEHTIESEQYSVSEQTAAAVNKALDEGRRIIAVGTTSCRALEAAGAGGRLVATNNGETALYIRPGYEFRIVKALITNFHLSKSSLLVLVSAFAGHSLIMRGYKTAVQERYRFFSYGDAMLIT